MGSNNLVGVLETLQSLAQNSCIRNPRPPADATNSSQQRIGSNKTKRAAVLVCLFEGPQGDLRVILTKRASTLSSHSGEVSLPGGKREEDDADDVETALREAKEEIGLDPSLVNVVTDLEPFVTKNGVAVVPVIGILSDKKAFCPIPNAAEVEALFDAPLEMFLKDENRRVEEKEWMGDQYLLHYFDYESENNKYVIWALTAGILIKAASIVFQRPPAFLERRPNFWNRAADSNATS
ncbi:nudix hydrolase 15, mitochondrial [Juglans microcarpa x Juglans regia]|uniref:nudix hydrolase 15, mitochondrial n=1 Tax=Juglans microcarpa x Juglans regia TaxID=2249226 RepID=UPI001B7F1DBA|nr:nudix hydrolase 15, mitochondrial [Juglans microcarpa x Juglans regia]